jgi:predicted O-methyltransferase YrrM
MDVELLIRNKFKFVSRDVSPTVVLPIQHGKLSSRLEMAEIFGEAGFKLGAEIGVNTGKFSLHLLQCMKDGKLILVDPWSAYDNCSDRRAECHYQATIERLSGFNIEAKRMTSMQAVKDIEDESLDFVYIDGLHDFNNAAMDIISWVPKVKKGGIVSGHDYYHGPDFGVVQAVDSYTKCNHIDTWYITREGVPSFFWVKK